MALELLLINTETTHSTAVYRLTKGHLLLRATIRKHPKKSRGLSEGQTRDIGQLLSQPSRHKMADILCASTLDSLSASEEEDRELEEARRPVPVPATKVDLSFMVTELKTFFASEMTVLKEDLSALTGRIRAAIDIHDLMVKQDSTTTQLQEVHLTYAQLSAKMVHLEDTETAIAGRLK
ncbi:Hypothetical predicted protein [Pelobates cultripes]|uniref:Uncharacterized protein n=1 Tax=Pelobates cultripes TaxID=61616 RepID=A0AAD1W8D5_PELCU|nr:Hypothetical predicted protein [Pelobates cultripes]